MKLSNIVDLIAIAAAIGGAAWFVTDKIDSGVSKIENRIDKVENRIGKVEAKIENLRLEIKADRKELRAEFKQDIKDSEARTDEKISLSDKMDQLHGVK